MICGECGGSGHDELGFLAPTCGLCKGTGTASWLQNLVRYIPRIITPRVRHKTKYRPGRLYRKALAQRYGV